MGKLPRLVVFALATLLCAALVQGGPPSASAAEPQLDDQIGAETAGEKEQPRPSVDAGAVYYGDSKHFKKPAEVDPDAVYAEIEEYQEILESDLKPGDVKYSILLLKASRRFRKAVRKAARADGHDLIARVGSVKGVDTVPNVTQSVIDRL